MLFEWRFWWRLQGLCSIIGEQLLIGEQAVQMRTHTFKWRRTKWKRKRIPWRPMFLKMDYSLYLRKTMEKNSPSCMASLAWLYMLKWMCVSTLKFELFGFLFARKSKSLDTKSSFKQITLLLISHASFKSGLAPDKIYGKRNRYVSSGKCQPANRSAQNIIKNGLSVIQ